MTKIFNSETRVPYIILTIVFIISIYPFFYMIMTSLMTAGEAINQYVFPRTPMLENYLEVWTSNNFQKYTINSIIISSITVVGVLTTSIPAAGRSERPGAPHPAVPAVQDAAPLDPSLSVRDHIP